MSDSPSREPETEAPRDDKRSKTGSRFHRAIVAAIVATMIAMVGAGVTALIADVISAGRSRSSMTIQMQALVQSVDTVGNKLDSAMKNGEVQRGALRIRLGLLEQRVSKMDGDNAGLLRSIDELKRRVESLERGDMRSAREPVSP